MVTMAPSIAIGEELGNGDDLVGFLRHFDLPEHQPLARGKGRDHVDRRFGAFLLVGTARGLAIDGDHLRCDAGQRRHPGHEAELEFLRIEGGKNIAEMIVGRCSMAKWPKPPQKIKFLLTEPGNVDERLCPAEHCQQTQQQNLIQRIDHLAGLTRVRQILEKVQKNSCFADRAKVDRRVFHRPSSKNESEDHDRFSISALCHVLLHPIALAIRNNSVDCDWRM